MAASSHSRTPCISQFEVIFTRLPKAEVEAPPTTPIPFAVLEQARRAFAFATRGVDVIEVNVEDVELADDDDEAVTAFTRRPDCIRPAAAPGDALIPVYVSETEPLGPSVLAAATEQARILRALKVTEPLAFLASKSAPTMPAPRRPSERPAPPASAPPLVDPVVEVLAPVAAPRSALRTVSLVVAFAAAAAACATGGMMLALSLGL